MAGKTRIGPLARIGAYASNVVKEAKEFGSAYMAADEAQNQVGPGANKASARANKRQQAEQGQLLGAILQGRRYNNKGKQR